jgi:hypothetical protein
METSLVDAARTKLLTNICRPFKSLMHHLAREMTCWQREENLVRHKSTPLTTLFAALASSFS